MPEKDKLRMQAEARLAQSPENMAALSPEETRLALHELRVHQIELEMQNEEMRLAQVELEISQGRYFDLYDLAPVGYVTVSEKGLILEANLTAAGLLGVARGALVKHLFSRFILKEDHDIYYLYRKQLFETGRPQDFELRMLKKDRTVFWAHLAATAALYADGAPLHSITLSDITERKQAEIQMQAAQAELQRLLVTAEQSRWVLLNVVEDQKKAEEDIRLLNAELEQLALTDHLTNLYNRRYFMQRGVEECKRANRNSQPLTLLMLDIDEFKKINDSYGHEAGDLALQQVAVALKSSLRETDILGRLGGEEFAILLPNTPLHDAASLAERTRQSIANMSFQMPGDALISTITISVGAAAFTDEMSDIDDLLRNADAAMYRAKKNGRNCVSVYE